MTTYRITAPNGKTYQIEGPAGASDADVARAVMAQFPESAQAAPPAEESGFLRQVADVPLGVARGAAMGVRMVADAFGANNPVSNSIKGVEGYLSGLLSAQAKQDEQEVARIMKDAEDKGVLEQVKAGFKAFATAPVDLLSQGLGTAAPAIVGGLGATLLRVGATGARAVGAGIGAGMGSGAVKGQIYEGVKEALAETGMSADQVEARAQLAQAYGGENLDMILAGAALGGLASATGIEPILARQAAKSIVGRSIAGRAATTGVAEAAPEIAQGSQEQLAQNLALQREGFDVDTFRGVAGAGTLEGLAGAGLGAAVGALPSAGAAPELAPPAAPELADTEPAAPVAPVAPAGETEAQAAARRIAELEGDDFGPLGQPIKTTPPTPTVAPGATIEADEVPDFEGMLFDEVREYKPIADQEPSLRDAYEQKKNSWGAATEAANTALQSKDYMVFAPFQGLYPKTAKRLEVLIGQTPTPVTEETPSGTPTPEAVEAKTQEPQVPRVPVPPKQVDRFGELRPGPLDEDQAPPRLSDEEIAELGLPTEARQPRAPKGPKAPTIKPIENPANIGADEGSTWKPGEMPATVPVATGGVPFRSRREAEAARRLQPAMRLLKVPNGFLLTPKTDAQMDAQARAGRKIGMARAGERGTPRSAIEFIAEKGGLDPRFKSETIYSDRNPRVGNRFLFAGQGKGLTLGQVSEALQQEGYIDVDDINLALDAINRGTYNAEGYERLAEMERDRLEQENKLNELLDEATAEWVEELGYDVSDLVDAGFLETTDKVKAEVAEMLKRAEALGIHEDDVFQKAIDDAYTNAQLQGRNQPTQYEIYTTARKELQSVFERGPEDRIEDTGQPSKARDDLTLVPPTREAQAEAERRAAQEPADRERAQVKRESEAGADQFRLEGGEGRQDLTGKLFQKEDERGKKPSLAYHAGNLEYGRDTTLGRMMGGRSTGHFGTGVYFVSDPSKISGREDRPVQAVDLSQYNLAVMRSEFSARMLHDGLKAVNRMESADDLDTPEGQRAVRDLAFALKLPEDVIREAAIAAAAEAAPLKEIYAFENDYIDSASTRFMKRLGYDGVDTRGAEGFDTTEYGTVVYAQSLANQAEGDGIVGQLFQQDSGVVGDEIIVDGKVRPTKNSDGRLIENDPQKLRNFWRFFGDSKVVDEQGEPIVVYHGTMLRESPKAPGMGDIKAFDRLFSTKVRAPSIDTVGSWFSTNAGEGGAEMYSGKGAGSAIYPAYLSIQNPQVTTFQLMASRARKLHNGKDDGRRIGKEEVEAYRDWLQSMGKDGIKIEGSGNEGSTEFDNQVAWIALDPRQIKSAIGNEGSYSDQSPNIVESKDAGKGWAIDPKEQAMERELTGKSVDEMGQWIVDNAPNKFAKVIAQKVQARIKEMQRRGVNMKIEVLGGNRRPSGMYGSRGSLTYTFTKNKPADMLLQLNGAAVVDNQAGYPPGMRYITVLHEMLHMATVAQTAGLSSSHPLIRDLNSIRNTVVKEFNKRQKAGNLSEFEQKIYNRSINALKDADEVLAWGLTDSDMQKFMASIKVGEKTLFDRFVELMRDVLGLGVDYESAMDRLVKTSDSLLDMSIDEIEGGILQKGYMFGPAQPRLQPGDTMQGELFSAQQPPIDRRERRNIFNQTPLTQWTKPDETKMADFIYTMQDKLVDTKDVIKAIEDQNGKIEEEWNPYLQEELYHGRTAKQTGDFLSDEMRPLVKMMDRMGVTIDELDTYLHNRIAEQRNEQAAALNPALPDGGSGIMTADARAYLDGLTKEQKAKYEQLAKKVDEISRGTRELLVDTGLESQETIDSWEKSNPNYVPLFREDVDYGVTKEVTTGLGFNTKGGTSKRFMGSQRNVVNILANIAMQRERAIVRSNKNRVALATYGLALKNPNPGFWLAVNPDAKNIDKVIEELMAMGLTKEDAKGVMQEPVQARVKREKNPKTGLMEEQIVYEVNPAARGKFDVFATRVDGKDRYVFFNGNDPRAARMVTALKNLDADSLGRAMGMAAMVTRYFAAINTQYNPIFGAVNFLRDMQGAAIQVSNTPLAGKRADIIAGAFPALKGIYTSLRADTKGKTAPMGQWAKLWDEFQQEGGQTGFRDQFSRSDERAEALEKELKQISEGKAKKFGRGIFNWLSDYNDAMENALRLSAYKAGLDKGLSKQEAASVAKNLTVNFNRKGQIGVQANALYAFFNAAVQGTARLLQTLGTVENGKFRLTKVGKTILGGGFLLGSLQALALAAAGFDDDEPPQFIRERNLIIPTFDGKYITIPMPLGYNVIPNTSRIITEFVLSGGKDPAKRVAAITSAFLDMFNPIGNAGWSAQTIAPTIADPLVALTENKDWTGKPIAREDFSNLDPTPGYTRAKETASWFSKNLSEFMNFASGGTKYQPGVFSPTPDQIDYLIGVATGGVGRELLKLEQTVTGAVTGEEVPTYKIPLAGRFFGDTKAAASEANKFYTNLKELNQHENEIKGRRKDKGDVAGYIRENPESRLVNAANAVERNVQALRKKRRELVESDAPKEKVQQIEKQITAQMKRLNDMVAKLEK